MIKIKKITLLLLSLIIMPIALSLSVTSCGTGGGNVSIGASIESATNGTLISGNTCSNMETGSTCTIALTLNNNGTPALNLTYTPFPLPDQLTNNPSFVSDVANCNTQINDSNNIPVTCSITVTYETANPGLPNSNAVDLTFYLGTTTDPDQASSPVITLSGD